MTKTDRQGVWVEWLVSCYTPFGVKRLHPKTLDAFDSPGNQFGGGEASEASHSQVERPKSIREPSLRRKPDKNCYQPSHQGLDG